MAISASTVTVVPGTGSEAINRALAKRKEEGASTEELSGVFKDLMTREMLGTINAPLLQKAEQRQKQEAIAKQRMETVGFVQYASEQQETQRMMRILETLKRDASPEIKAALGGFIENFQENPLSTAQEMYRSMSATATAIPGMEEILQKIQELMDQPEENLAKLLKQMSA